MISFRYRWITKRKNYWSLRTRVIWKNNISITSCCWSSKIWWNLCICWCRACIRSSLCKKIRCKYWRTFNFTTRYWWTSVRNRWYTSKIRLYFGNRYWLCCSFNSKSWNRRWDGRSSCWSSIQINESGFKKINWFNFKHKHDDDFH